ncbi:Hypothetical protein A7982_01560 [Minicystis rosea]|nr:Hypothetical protein A7982_01560 [Minicystis rosea]
MGVAGNPRPRRAQRFTEDGDARTIAMAPVRPPASLQW